MENVNTNSHEALVHEPKVLKVTPFEGDTGAVAAVTLAYGPVVIRARLQRGQHGIFLSMPARKGADDKWREQASFRDFNLQDRFQKLALDEYQACLQAA